MEQQRILITGAHGFVGTWLNRLLQEIVDSSHCEVVTCGRSDLNDIKLDLLDRLDTYRVVKDIQPSSIIHLAAIAAPMEAQKDPSSAWNVNFQGTLNLASTTLSVRPSCKFIYASSSEVYGQTFLVKEGKKLDEQALLQPRTVYGAAKSAADIAIGQMHYDGLRAIRFRPFNHTGPGQSENFVVSAFAKQVAEIILGIIPPIIEVGNLDAERDFVDVRDIVRAYASAAIEGSTEHFGEAFNLSSGRRIRISEILKTLIDISNCDIEVKVNPDRLRGPEIPVAVGDSKKASSQFGWKPRISMDKTIRDVLQYWLAHISRVDPPRRIKEYKY